MTVTNQENTLLHMFRIMNIVENISKRIITKNISFLKVNLSACVLFSLDVKSLKYVCYFELLGV